MKENKIIKLFTGEKIKTKTREFTRIMGGFGDNKPVITVKQISELLNKEIKHVNERINANIQHFDNIHIIDLKVVDQSDYNLETLQSLGYTKMQISKAKNIYVLSESGFLLFLKFAEGEKAIEIYKDFIEDYFKIQAENIVMEKTLQEIKQTIIDERKYILGSVIFETDTTKKMELLQRDKKLEEQQNEIDRTLAKEELMEQVQDIFAISERFTNSNKLYDTGNFSKILDIKGLGRNNFFEWLRETKMLNSKNIPYATHSEHFKVIPIEYIKTQPLKDNIEWTEINEDNM